MTVLLKVVLALSLIAAGFCQILNQLDDYALTNQDNRNAYDDYDVIQEDANHKDISQTDETSETKEEWNEDQPTIEVEDSDLDSLIKLCAQFKTSIIKSPHRNVNCLGFLGTQNFLEEDPDQFIESNDSSNRHKRQNEEGSGDGPEPVIAEDDAQQPEVPPEEDLQPEATGDALAPPPDSVDSGDVREQANATGEGGNPEKPPEEAAAPEQPEEESNPEPPTDAEEPQTDEEPSPAAAGADALPEEPPISSANEETPAEGANGDTPASEGAANEETPAETAVDGAADNPPPEEAAKEEAKPETPEDVNGDAAPSESAPNEESSVVDSASGSPGNQRAFASNAGTDVDASKPKEGTSDSSGSSKNDAVSEDSKNLTNQAPRTVADAKSGESTEQKTGSGGGKITLLVVAGIIIIGAAAFAYNYFKKKVTTQEPANNDRELVEITVNKNVDQKAAEESSPAEKKPLLENNANGSGVQENQKNGNADDQSKQRQ